MSALSVRRVSFVPSELRTIPVDVTCQTELPASKVAHHRTSPPSYLAAGLAPSLSFQFVSAVVHAGRIAWSMLLLPVLESTATVLLIPASASAKALLSRLLLVDERAFELE